MATAAVRHTARMIFSVFLLSLIFLFLIPVPLHLLYLKPMISSRHSIPFRTESPVFIIV